LNARDVFARRPACHSLWVVPAVGHCRPQLSSSHCSTRRPARFESYAVEPYAVCAKQSQRQAMTYVDYLGWVEAHSAAEALRLAPAAFDVPEATVWWAFPKAAFTQSDPADAPGLEAATGKRFRLPNQYHTVFTMQQIRRGDEETIVNDPGSGRAAGRPACWRWPTTNSSWPTATRSGPATRPFWKRTSPSPTWPWTRWATPPSGMACARR
jgi:hypothetical protein